MSLAVENIKVAATMGDRKAKGDAKEKRGRAAGGFNHSNFFTSSKVSVVVSSAISGSVSLHFTQCSLTIVLPPILVLCLDNGFSWMGQYGSLFLSHKTPNFG
jgi:hypothetical protein